MIISRVTLLLSLALSASPAQSPVGADTLGAKAVAESLAVLKTLDAAVRANRDDAAAWHRQGMIAWALTARAHAQPAIRGLDATRLGRLADTSLRIAAQIETKNPAYRLAVGRFLLTTGASITRLSAYEFFNQAVELARTSRDPELIAETAIEAGRVYWRRYDSQANRRLWASREETELDTTMMGEPPKQVDACSYPGGLAWRWAELYPQRSIATEPALNQYHNTLLECTSPVEDMGAADYQRSEELFREAYQAAPSNTRAFRLLAALLAEKRRWTELSPVATDRVRRLPNDPWGWLALGLAQHRSDVSHAAVASFDSAIAHMPLADKQRLFGLQRVLRPTDTTAFIRASAEQQAGSEQLHWMMADPLWSRAGNDARTEFLSRVTFAELRWTVEELNVRGADSDRGEVYIRYGPPDRIATVVPPAPPPLPDVRIKTCDGECGVRTKEIAGRVATMWDYDNGLFFIFEGMPAYGTSQYRERFVRHIPYLLDKAPAQWDNLGTERIVDMPVRMARFRTASDSVDLYLATRAPMAPIREAAGGNAPVTSALWLLGQGIPLTISDSSQFENSGTKVWVYRLQPTDYLYRIEATATGATAAGRTNAWVRVGNDSATGFTTRGFGISDVLLATQAQRRAGALARWTDFAIAPLFGDLARGGQLALVWENYEFGSREGSARYQIAVTLERERSGPGRVAAEVVSALATAAGVDRRPDRVTFRFDRITPQSPAIVDQITLGLAETPPGNYRVTLEVTDQVTGRKTSRVFGVTISELGKGE